MSEATIKPLTLNFGPQHPAAHGVLRMGCDSMADVHILAKVDGEVFAVDSRCPHAGGQIQTGPLEKDRFVVCPLHRYLFDPRTGHAEGVACAPVKRYRVVTQGDDVEVFV